MSNENKQINLVPPRLNAPFIVFGFTTIEAIVLIGFLVMGIGMRKSSLLTLSALFAALFCRFVGNPENKKNYITLIYKKVRYYITPQIFLRRLCKDAEESSHN